MAALYSSIKAGEPIPFLPSQSLLLGACHSSSSLQPRLRLQRVLTKQRRVTNFSIQVFADAAPRLYYVGRIFSHLRTMDTRLQSSAGNAEPTLVRTVPVQVAHELLNAGHRYLDVRTVEEFAAGHVEGAVNIPYMHKVGTGMTKNEKFLEEVSSQFGKDDEIVVGCQSGRRSLMAATELVAVEFTGVTDIAGGYGAWVQSGLPTSTNM